MGTNSLGQDVFWRMTFAIRNSLAGRACRGVDLQGHCADGGLGGRLLWRQRRSDTHVHQRWFHRAAAIIDPRATGDADTGATEPVDDGSALRRNGMGT